LIVSSVVQRVNLDAIKKYIKSMNNLVKILAFAGSTRKNSINKILVSETARISEKQGFPDLNARL